MISMKKGVNTFFVSLPDIRITAIPDNPGPDERA